MMLRETERTKNERETDRERDESDNVNVLLREGENVREREKESGLYHFLRMRTCVCRPRRNLFTSRTDRQSPIEIFFLNAEKKFLNSSERKKSKNREI